MDTVSNVKIYYFIYRIYEILKIRKSGCNRVVGKIHFVTNQYSLGNGIIFRGKVSIFYILFLFYMNISQRHILKMHRFNELKKHPCFSVSNASYSFIIKDKIVCEIYRG